MKPHKINTNLLQLNQNEVVWISKGCLQLYNALEGIEEYVMDVFGWARVIGGWKIRRTSDSVKLRWCVRCYDVTMPYAVIAWMLMYQNDQECQLDESNGVGNGLNGMGWWNAQDLSTHAAIFIGGFCILYVYTMMMNANEDLNPSLQLIQVSILIEIAFILNKIDESIELLHLIHSISVFCSAFCIF